MAQQPVVIYHEGFITGPETIKSCAQKKNIQPKKLIFIFASNDSHHVKQTLFNCHGGAGQASVAKKLVDQGYPALGIPTVFSEETWDKKGQENTLDAACIDLFRAAGAGYSFVIPSMNDKDNRYGLSPFSKTLPGSNTCKFTGFLDSAHSWGRAPNGTGHTDAVLAEKIHDRLALLIHTVRNQSFPEDQKNTYPQLFKAYQEGQVFLTHPDSDLNLKDFFQANLPKPTKPTKPTELNHWEETQKMFQTSEKLNDWQKTFDTSIVSFSKDALRFDVTTFGKEHYQVTATVSSSSTLNDKQIQELTTAMVLAFKQANPNANLAIETGSKVTEHMLMALKVVAKKNNVHVVSISEKKKEEKEEEENDRKDATFPGLYC